MVLLNSMVLFLNSAMYFTIPLYNPRMATDCIELKKFRKFPIKAKPSAPTNKAMALEVKNPAIILVKTDAEFNEATFTSTLLFIYLSNVFN